MNKKIALSFILFSLVVFAQNEINFDEYSNILNTQKVILEVLSKEFTEIIKNVISSKKYEDKELILIKNLS